MWTVINQVYTTRDSQNAWAHLASDNKWHKILTGATDGVSNVFVVLTCAKGNGKQAYVVLDAAKNITGAYM